MSSRPKRNAAVPRRFSPTPSASPAAAPPTKKKPKPARAVNKRPTKKPANAPPQREITVPELTKFGRECLDTAQKLVPIPVKRRAMFEKPLLVKIPRNAPPAPATAEQQALRQEAPSSPVLATEEHQAPRQESPAPATDEHDAPREEVPPPSVPIGCVKPRLQGPSACGFISTESETSTNDHFDSEVIASKDIPSRDVGVNVKSEKVDVHDDASTLLGVPTEAIDNEVNKSSAPRQESFFARMERRRLQNPLARGLLSTESVTNSQDYFYREILARKVVASENADGNSESEEIDILNNDCMPISTTAETNDNDDVMIKNPALDCVASIRNVLPGPSENDDNDEESSKTIMEAIFEECDQGQADMYKQLKALLTSIVHQRLIDVNSLHIVGGCSVFYHQTLKNAARLRDRLYLLNKLKTQGLEDAHAFLLQRLPNEFLAAYLNLLRFLKVSGSNVSTELLEHFSGSLTIHHANEFIRDFVNVKVVDPNLRHEVGNEIAPIPNVSLVLVYPQVSAGAQVVDKHAHENIFRRLLPPVAPCVEKIELKFEKATNTNSRTLTHMCLALIRVRVQELLKRRPDDHVFLVGWGITSLLNMQAIQKLPGVTGVLNFAFPQRSYFGFRGTVDDSMCLSYCPSLFVVGDAASNVDLEELKKSRENMISNTGLIVVGGADKDLRVSPLRLSVERVSQYCVDRVIVEHVVDFMRQVVGEGGLSARERRPYLKPINVPSQFNVNLSTLKSRALAGSAPNPRQQQTKGPVKKKEPAKKKKNQQSREPTIKQEQDTGPSMEKEQGTERIQAPYTPFASFLTSI